ncbi:peptide-binding protein [Xanthomonas phaseoli pv. phaseoli]|uniref:SH3 domain-containing protein n=12 Tax=Xanthomonas TaxID=338 RepID=A0AAI8ERD0_XANAC|nr:MULTISPECIES: SH3 domain-containing protein [Xanthomonas]MBO9746495.1 peptide-binding protein [Xanthomonas phaseoli pv. dieffenbachiae]MBV6782394.1 peptide-binding protein [Xanthomonas campestris pv. trichodesmae]MEE5091539.1 SH3 domain-containing protein [Xanthomonas euvesicatoria]OOW52021.1 peptide-binding protein [Xanthomonas campestris pv. centellae]OOW64041.1 peptide-binding protein [Xanthomonas campestris pv. thespesiae]OOW73998.1 peptide-binding protein [Xanthomonas campestris pv. l
MRARLLCDHRAAYANPVRFQAGQQVGLGVRDEEWPAFAWVTTDSGRAGWAPLAWLRPLGDGRAEALRDYDARELDAQTGEDVLLHHEHGGWWWSERADGTQGWLPAADLELLDDTTPQLPAAQENLP